MTTRLVIVRHGNTFAKGQTPLRVGARTDLPLVETERGTNVGKYLRMKSIIPDVVYTAPLKRTKETARLAIAALDKDIKLIEDVRFREIDYGPDEGKTEEEVVARIGQKAIEEWDRAGIVPDGWTVCVEDIINEWKNFAEEIESNLKNKTVMVVSSNGIIRLAPHLTGDFKQFAEDFNIKVSTGGVCILEKEEGDENWTVSEWGTKPKDKLANSSLLSVI